MLWVIGIVIVLAAIGCISIYTVRRRRTPLDLPDEWWPAFEREFRAYTRRMAHPHQDVERRRHGGRPKGR